MDIYYEKSEHIFPSIIETKRLQMERISYEVVSVKELYEVYKNVSEESTKYVTFSHYESPEEAKNFIDSSIAAFENGESSGGYFIKLKNEDHNVPFIGTCGFETHWERSVAESGIFLLEDFWGNGYSTERGEAMLELAFEEFDFNHWISKCHPENQGSIGAIENYIVENGGRRVGVIPNDVKYGDEYMDTLYFAISKDEYRS